jgi:hypothetical protein
MGRTAISTPREIVITVTTKTIIRPKGAALLTTPEATPVVMIPGVDSIAAEGAAMAAEAEATNSIAARHPRETQREETRGNRQTGGKRAPNADATKIPAHPEPVAAGQRDNPIGDKRDDRG